MAPTLRTCVLESLRLVRVAGTDRSSFLQGQLTQDVALATSARSALYGWTTAQGRLLATGQLVDWRDAFWLTVPAALADGLVRRLRMFVLRAHVSVELADVAPGGIAGATADAEFRLDGARLPATPLAQAAAGDWCATRVGGDPGRLLVLGAVSARDALLAALPATPMTEADWRAADIRAGLPSIAPATAEAFIPQMVNLELVGGVSFDKGCYTGQEIVARTRYLGRVKRRMLRFRCAGPAIPAPGDAVYAVEREAGQVVAAAGTGDGIELLAVVPLEKRDEPLYADAGRQHALVPLDLPYAIPPR